MRDRILMAGALGVALALCVVGGLRRAEAAASTAGSDPVLTKAVYASVHARLDRTPAGRAPRSFHPFTEEEAVERARETAERLLSEGRLGWEVHDTWTPGKGGPRVTRPPGVHMEDVLDRDFGIELFYRGGGCIIEPHLQAEMKAFNAIMKPAIVKKHGAQVFAIAEARARRATARGATAQGF